MRPTVFLTVLGMCLMAMVGPARAAEQVTSDPDDAYALGSQGQSDIRAVEWTTSGPDVTAVLRLEPSPSFAAFVFLDVDRDGRADYALSVDGGSGSPRFDAQIEAVPESTAACQLYDGPALAHFDDQIATASDDDGRMVLKVAFPASAIGGAGSFNWAAFGLTLNGFNPPGWDYVPDRSNPDAAVAQPADRSCHVDQVPGTGIRLKMAAGVVFPTPAPSDAAPVASFDFEPVEPLSGDAVTFTSTSSDEEGPLASQRWDLDGDGLYDDATGPRVTHAFARRGPHVVGLLVEDSAGAVATVRTTVQVKNRPPVVSITLPTVPVQPEQRFRLEAVASDDGELTSFAWDTDDDGAFDDGEGTVAEPVFPTKGPRTVRVRVVDDGGAATVASATAVVANRPPRAVLRLVPARVRYGEPVVVDVSGSSDPDGDPVIHNFTFPDGYQRTGPEQHYSWPAYVRPGLHTVSVHAYDGRDFVLAEALLEVLPPAPPEVRITGPDPGVVVVNGTLRLSFTQSRGSKICVTVDEYGMPPGCQEVRPPYRDVPVALHPGINRVTVWVQDSYGQISSATSFYEGVGPESGLDLRVNMIEITQGTQWERSSWLRDPTPGAARVADYIGVRLAHGGPTYARVFANARSLARGGQLPRNVTVTLEGFSRGGRLPGGPLLPIDGPETLRRGTTHWPPEMPERLDARAAYTFALPDEWTRHPELRLDATVDPAGVFPECATCRRDNTHSLRWVPFVAPTQVVVSPIRVLTGPVAEMKSSSEELDILRRVLPGGDSAVTIEPYRGPVDLSAVARGSGDTSLASLLELALYEQGNPANGITLGAGETSLIRGMALPVPGLGEWVAISDTGRPLTSVAHELGHEIGLRHASSCTNNPAADPGGFGGVLAERWFPDEEGRLQGYALDLRPGSGTVEGRNTGPFRVIGPGGFDLMSYCADTGDMDSWLSPRNWNRRLGGSGDEPVVPRRARTARASTAQAAQPALTVAAAVDAAGGVEILQVAAAPDGARPTAPEDAGPYLVRVRRADGTVQSETRVAAPDVIVEGVTTRARLIMAVVPGDDPASVEIVPAEGSPVLAERRASPSAPAVSLTAPVVRGGKLRVAWTARDADGADGLVARVDVAADGRRFRTVALDAARSPAEIPLTVGGRAARVRVTVSDGMREASAVSAPFALPAGPSAVDVLDPGPGSVLSSDAPVILRAQALSTAGRRVTPTWFAGARRLGRGRVLSTSLPAGRHTLRAVAPDGTSDAVRVRVSPAPPRLIALTKPARVRRTARVVRLEVAANQPATLRAGGRRFDVGRRARTIAVPVRAGRRALQLRLVLRAGGRRATQTVVIARR